MSSGSKSESESSGMNFSKSFISPDQLPFLKDLWGQASNFLLGGGANANTGAGGQLMGNILNNPFSGQMQQFANPNNAMAQQNINQLGQSLGQNLQNNLLPSIANQSISSGGFGGGRQGVAQGIALQGTQEAFGEGAQGILNNTYNQAQQGAQFGADLSMRNALGGIQGLTGLQQQQFAPLMALAQILGNPAILNKSYGENESNSYEVSAGGLS